MTRILLSFFLILLFHLNSLANLGKNSPVPKTIANSILPSFQQISDDQRTNIIFWENSSLVGNTIPQFFLQRIDENGELLWGKNVSLATRDNYLQSSHKIIPDGSGGVIIAWESRRPGEDDTDLYIQKIDSTGRKLWGEDGVPIASAPGSQITPFLIKDARGGAIVAWSDSRNDPTYANWDIYAQHINSEGLLEWNNSGIVVSADQKDEFIGNILPLPNGGFTIVWNMVIPGNLGIEEGYDFHSKQLDSKGEWIPATNTTKFLSLPLGDAKYRFAKDISNDGSGGFFISLISSKGDQANALYIQHVLSSGQPAFGDQGILIDQALADVQDLGFETDSAGNYAVTWSAWKDSSLLTFISKFDSSGNPIIDTLSTEIPREQYLTSNDVGSSALTLILEELPDSKAPQGSPPEVVPDSLSSRAAVPPAEVEESLVVTHANTASSDNKEPAVQAQIPGEETRFVDVPVITIAEAVPVTNNYSFDLRDFHVASSQASSEYILARNVLVSRIIKSSTQDQNTIKRQITVLPFKSRHLLHDQYPIPSSL